MRAAWTLTNNVTMTSYSTGTSATLGKQGGVMAGQLAALALQPVLIAADSALRESGGCALAIIDESDGYLLGPPRPSLLSLQNTRRT